MVDHKGYYKILELKEPYNKVTDNDIKKSYRKLAMKYHPDKTNLGDGSDEKFKQINEAYEILGDKQKRHSYDNPQVQIPNGIVFAENHGSDIIRQFMNMHGGHFNINLNSSFNQGRRSTGQQSVQTTTTIKNNQKITKTVTTTIHNGQTIVQEKTEVVNL